MVCILLSSSDKSGTDGFGKTGEVPLPEELFFPDFAAIGAQGLPLFLWKAGERHNLLCQNIWCKLHGKQKAGFAVLDNLGGTADVGGNGRDPKGTRLHDADRKPFRAAGVDKEVRGVLLVIAHERLVLNGPGKLAVHKTEMLLRIGF